MFDGQFRSHTDAQLSPLGHNLKKLGVKADHLTVLGVVMAGATALAIANGALRLAFLIGLVCAFLDVLDGAVAKASGTASPRGAFFDSVCDRVSDAFLFGGVAWYLSSQPGAGRVAVLPLAVLAVSLIISYERAKADALGYDARGGLMERAERLIALGLAVLFPQFMVAILWIMLALTLFTAVTRFVKVWRQASGEVTASAVSPTVARLRARRQARMSRTAARRAERRVENRMRFINRDRLASRNRPSTPRRRTDKP
jgi:CDP-diacylglycerol--glycerol-3-phosphate 3-phosphatidyltransferase